MEDAVPAYRPELLEGHAAALRRRSATATAFWGRLGVLVGLLAGAGAATSTPAGLGVRAALVVGSVLAGFAAGRAVGARRAAAKRFRAQLLLCNVHLQYATLALWRTLREVPQPARVIPLPVADEQEIAARVAAAVAAAADEPPLSSVAR